jgi:uncharacterized RDD family membrane protein YckC
MRAARLFRPVLCGGMVFGVAVVMPHVLAAEQVFPSKVIPSAAVTVQSTDRPVLKVDLAVVPSGRIILRRFAARCVDWVLIASGGYLFGFVLLGSSFIGAVFCAVVELIKDMELYGYRSPGKALLGLVVTDVETGETPVKPWKSAVRNALGPCSMGLLARVNAPALGLALFFNMVNDVWALFSTRRQTMMDYVAGTIVYHV